MMHVPSFMARDGSQRLDDSKTAAFSLGPAPERAPLAVLLLHGFTGSPWEVRPVGEALAARGFHVRCPRLPGHGTTPEAMLWVDHREWVRAAAQELETLRGARRLIIAGLSMGALLGMILAARRTQRIDGLVLMAPVVRFRGVSERLFSKLSSPLLLSLLQPWKQKDGTDIELDEVRAQSPVLARYPMARASDLVALQRLARAAEPRVECPSLVLAAAHDHVVDPNAVESLSRRLPFSRLVWLQRGFHIIPRDADRALALTEIAHFAETVAS